MDIKAKPTLGVVVGNRGFFPGHLVESGRETILRVLGEEGINAVALGTQDTKYGGVETLADAVVCGELLKAHADELDGILITLPNFGDEKAVPNSIRFSGLNLPVLVHAFNDDQDKMTSANRRDSFCGKLSLCNSLTQYGIPFTLTRQHTVDPTTTSFRQDLRQFVSTCRVVKGLKHARVGAIGARPAAFNTVRYSEKLLERNGISVETLDLSEVFGRVNRLEDGDPAVIAKRSEIKVYAKTQGVPDIALDKMAKLGVVVDRFIADNRLQMTAVQCWTSMEEFFGVTPCTIMSMLSNKLVPSACETDVAGVVGMYALALASGQPSALLDWNNNFGDDPNKAVVFHCSNLPQQIFTDIPVMTFSDIFGATVGQKNAYGTIAGRIKPSPFTFCRVSTDDYAGKIKAYVGEGEFTPDPMITFGGYGVAKVPNLQELLQHICNNGFEHHVAVTSAVVGDAVYEAMNKYLGWDTYRHH
jgi:L-fucose isomerase-like protein